MHYYCITLGTISLDHAVYDLVGSHALSTHVLDCACTAAHTPPMDCHKLFLVCERSEAKFEMIEK